jgi:hypothetical protein
MLFTLFMKNNPNTPKFFGFLIAVVIIIVSFAIFTFQTNNQTAEPSTSNTPNIVSQNNITMQLISAHTEGSNGYRVEVCYNLPDQRDWLLTYPKSPLGTILSVNGKHVQPFEEGTMYWKYDQNGSIVQRCQYLFFVIGIKNQNGIASLQIKNLYARQLEQSDYCNEISQKMGERNYSITIDCMNVNGISGFVYTKVPINLLYFDPVFKNIIRDVKWDTYAGPWSFTFPINPR